MSSIKGTRTRSVVTFNASTVSPGEELYIDIPKLKPSSCLVPGTFNLLFDFKNANTKSWFLNNLAKLLSQRLQIKLAGETVYDCSGEYLYGVYKDMWLTVGDRDKMIECGLADENLRKLMSKDDSGATTGDTTKVSDVLMFSVYGSKLKIPLERIIADHGLYAPFRMNSNFMYVVTLPKASDIMMAQSSEKVGGYTLENLELEYETIENQSVADEISNMYSTGRSLSYQHVTLMRTSNWGKDLTIVNEKINLPKKSMAAIVLLFTKQTRANSEEYVYPNIDEVKITIEGVPSSIFSQDLPKSRFFEEARRFFCPTDEFMSIQKFFKDGFTLVVDLRSNEDDVTGNGKEIVNTQSGVLLEIKKQATTENVVCNLSVVSDALVNFVNRDLQSIQY
jgi:hypothetical protein